MTEKKLLKKISRQLDKTNLYLEAIAKLYLRIETGNIAEKDDDFLSILLWSVSIPEESAGEEK